MASTGTPRIADGGGELGVVIPGIGAVSTTFMAGVEALKRGLGLPAGSLTQMGTIRLGKRTDNRVPKIREFVPLAIVDQLVFGGWDIYEDTAYEAARNAKVLEESLLEQVKEPLSSIAPMKAVFDHEYVKRMTGANVKLGGSKMEKGEMLMADIDDFRRGTKSERLVMMWCGSTEVFHKPGAVHQTLRDFECGLQKNDPEIAPSQIYAYAALKRCSVCKRRAKPDTDAPGQGAHDGAGPVPGARSFHPADEAEEYAALDAGRRPHHPPRP